MQPDPKPITADTWKQLQRTLNELGLSDPRLEVDGIPGPKTLAAAQGLVPLIERVMVKDKAK